MAEHSQAARVRAHSWAFTFGADRREREEVLRVFGGKLKTVRNVAAFSQGELAARCFMPHDQISALERGLRSPDLIALLIIGHTLGVSIDQLTTGLPAPMRRAGTAQLLDLITRQPGATMSQIEASTGLPPWYIHRLAVHLQATGAIVSGTGWRLARRSHNVAS